MFTTSKQDVVIKELIKILKIAKKYDCPDVDKYINNLQVDTYESVKTLIMEASFETTKCYSSVLKNKEYDYFNRSKNNELKFPNDMLNDFVKVTWDQISLKDRKRIFRSLSKIYNESLKA